jgi:hypothetical protein
MLEVKWFIDEELNLTRSYRGPLYYSLHYILMDFAGLGMPCCG